MKKIIIVIAAAIAICIGGVVFANTLATKDAKKELDAQIASLPSPFSNSVTYDDVSANAITNTVTISNIGAPEIGSIGEVTIKGDFRENEIYIPEDMDISIENIRLNGMLGQIILMSAPDELKKASYDFHIKWNYDASNDDGKITMDMAANDIASFSSDWAISDMSPVSDLINGDQAQNKMAIERQLHKAMNKIKFSSINMSLNNEGNLKALAESLLQKNGMTNEQLIQFLNSELANEAKAESKKALESFISFVSNWNKFELSALFPNDGMTMPEIQDAINDSANSDPTTLFDKINLKTSGN